MATLLNCKVTTEPTGNFRENTCEGVPQFAANPIGVFFDPARVYGDF